MPITIEISKRGGIFQGQTQRIVNRALTSAITETVTFLEREVKERTPVGFHGNRGAGLKQTIFGEVTKKGTRFVKGVVSHTSKYGNVIEKGRRPGKKMPPKGSLLDWIVFKFNGVDMDEAEDIEWGVRRNIAKFGTKGKHMFENAFMENEFAIDRIFRNAGFDISRKLTEK